MLEMVPSCPGRQWQLPAEFEAVPVVSEFTGHAWQAALPMLSLYRFRLHATHTPAAKVEPCILPVYPVLHRQFEGLDDVGGMSELVGQSKHG